MRVTSAILKRWLDAFDAQLKRSANAPLRTRRLRLFSTQEAAKIIGVKPDKLRRMSARGEMAPPESINGSKYGYHLADIHKAKTFLYESTGDERFAPHRAPRATKVAVANFKGGGGKTTTSAHLAQYLAIQGCRVLCVDADPQASLSRTFGLYLDGGLEGDTDIPGVDPDAENTLAGFFRDPQDPDLGEDYWPIRELILPTFWEGFIDVVPASLALFRAEFEIPMRHRKNPGWSFWDHLKNGLEDVRDDYDVIIIDTPPSLGYLTINAVYAADAVIVPLQATMMDFSSTGQFLKIFYEFVEELCGAQAELPDIKFFDFLVTRYNGQQEQHRLKLRLRRIVGENLIDREFLETAAVQSLGRETIYEIQPDKTNKRMVERAVMMADELNGHIFQQIKCIWDDGYQ